MVVLRAYIPSENISRESLTKQKIRHTEFTFYRSSVQRYVGRIALLLRRTRGAPFELKRNR